MNKFKSPTHVAIDHKANRVALLEIFEYRIGSMNTDKYVRVPAGFRCDMATIPIMIKPFFGRQIGLINKAAIVHDYLYEEKFIFKNLGGGKIRRLFINRDQADAIFYEAMQVAGVGRIKAWIIWAAVRLFGQKYWRE